MKLTTNAAIFLSVRQVDVGFRKTFHNVFELVANPFAFYGYIFKLKVTLLNNMEKI